VCSVVVFFFSSWKGQQACERRRTCFALENNRFSSFNQINNLAGKLGPVFAIAALVSVVSFFYFFVVTWKRILKF
jgi:hypothetical protein